MANKLYWIWLTMVFGAGNPRVWELLRECEDVKDAYDRVLNGKYSLTSGEKLLFAGASLEKAEEIVHFCEKENIFIFTYDAINPPITVTPNTVAAFPLIVELCFILSIALTPKLYPRCVHTILKINIAKYTAKNIIGPNMLPSIAKEEHIPATIGKIVNQNIASPIPANGPNNATFKPFIMLLSSLFSSKDISNPIKKPTKLG